MIRVNSSSVLYPDYIADSVLDIDMRELKRIGITHLVFDMDRTLVRPRTNTIPTHYIDRISFLKKAGFPS
jgi:predicted HAD superfamily phosphohydrolase YqeG